MSARPTGCAPWCSDHQRGDRPGDNHCQATAPTPAGDLLLEEGHDGRPVLLLHRLEGADLTLSQARELYAALGGLLSHQEMAA